MVLKIFGKIRTFLRNRRINQLIVEAVDITRNKPDMVSMFGNDDMILVSDNGINIIDSCYIATNVGVGIIFMKGNSNYMKDIRVLFNGASKFGEDWMIDMEEILKQYIKERK